MALRLTPRSPRGTGLFSPRRLADSSTRLDPSVGGSGPHGLTVRAPAARLAARSRPSPPAPRFVTTAKRLFGERGIASLNHNSDNLKRQMFLRGALRRAKQAAGFCCFARRVAGTTLAREHRHKGEGKSEQTDEVKVITPRRIERLHDLANTGSASLLYLLLYGALYG